MVRVFVSFSGYLWSYTTHSSNHWIYNLFLPLQCLGFLLVFYQSSLHPKVAGINGWLLMASPVVTILCWAKGASLESINLWAVVCFDFLLLLSVCMTFIDLLLRTDSIYFIRQPVFWLASGLFFYSVESIVGYSMWEYSRKMILFRLYTFIYFSGEYLLDAGIIGCFICLYWEGIKKK